MKMQGFSVATLASEGDQKSSKRFDFLNFVKKNPLTLAGARGYVAIKTLPTRLAARIEGRLLDSYGDWSRQRPQQLLRVVRAARRLGIRPAFFARAEAILTARTIGWGAAAPLFARVAADPRREAALAPASVATLLTGSSPASPVRLALPVTRHEADPTPELGSRIVIYTACFGRPFTLDPMFGVPASVRCLCFTDQPVVAPGWEVIHVETAADAFHKLCPHRVLPAVAPTADMSLYIAPERVIAGNLHTLFTRWLLPQPLVVWRHADCGDWHALAEHRLLRTPERTAEILAQAQQAERDQLPRGLGAYDTDVLWRRHGAPEVAALMDAWWTLQQAAPGPDDIHFYRLAHAADAQTPSPAIMPATLGSALDNAFFAERPLTRPAGKVRRSTRPTTPVPITFLYASRRHDKLMTLLRGRQLSEIVAARLGEGYDVAFVSDRHLDQVRDRIVILNMGFLAFASLAQLERLKRNNVALITDWQDGIVDREKVALCDAQMAMSLRQALDLNRAYPDVPAFHVTHNVNTGIRPSSPPEDQLRTLYFGATFNTVVPESLRDVVDVADGQRRDLQFDDFLPHYNCHWIVRRYVPIEQFWLVRGASPLKRATMALEQWKPFLKGFVAARCGAVVLVTRDDANALHYLGDDYPFYAQSLAVADLEAAWTTAAAAFGGPEWRHAQAIMRQVAARSSDDQVAAEFKAMVDAVIA